MDRRLQDLLRQTRADPADRTLLNQAVAALRRAGEGVPADLLDRVIRPARSMTFWRKVKVVAERPSGLWSRPQVGTQAEIPEHRTWWVTPQPFAFDDAVIEELRYLDVPGFRFGRTKELNAFVPRLAELPQLTWLSFAGAPCSDETLAALPEMPRLAEIIISGSKVTAAGLETLVARAPNLIRIELDRAKKVRDLSALSRLQHLRRLSLFAIPVTSLPTLPVSPELTHLSLGEVHFRANHLRSLSERAGKLTELTLHSALADTELFAELRRFPHLRALTLQAGRNEAANLEALTHLDHLRYLGVAVGDADPGHLAELQSLTHLTLAFPRAAHVHAAVRAPRLEQLTLSGIVRGTDPLSRESFAAIAAAKVPRARVCSWRYFPEAWSQNTEPLRETGTELHVERSKALTLEDFPDGVQVQLHDSIPVPPGSQPSKRASSPWAIY